jgi:hypothetical protein
MFLVLQKLGSKPENTLSSVGLFGIDKSAANVLPLSLRSVYRRLQVWGGSAAKVEKDAENNQSR